MAVQFSFLVNDEPRTVAVDPAMPLLWMLREKLGLAGTKYGCGAGFCGACMVLLDGEAVRSCLTPAKTVANRAIVTIEGIPPQSPVLQAWISEGVSQCGYCQPGQIITTTALLAANPNPSDADIDQALSGNLCRCGTYARIRVAIHKAAASPE